MAGSTQTTDEFTDEFVDEFEDDFDGSDESFGADEDAILEDSISGSADAESRSGAASTETSSVSGESAAAGNTEEPAAEYTDDADGSGILEDLDYDPDDASETDEDDDADTGATDEQTDEDANEGASVFYTDEDEDADTGATDEQAGEGASGVNTDEDTDADTGATDEQADEDANEGASVFYTDEDEDGTGENASVAETADAASSDAASGNTSSSDAASRDATSSDAASGDAAASAAAAAMQDGVPARTDAEKDTALMESVLSEALVECTGWGQSAGSSLRAASAATSLLQWSNEAAAGNADPEALDKAVREELDRLSPEQRENLKSNWDFISYDVDYILDEFDSFRNVLEDAGCLEAAREAVADKNVLHNWKAASGALENALKE
ncbi:MAG: hypothetical protein Q4D81_05275 [Eubacteriales bacterium]|nr:hypothetical protein [Eubacteriales bacterium]